MYTVRYSESWEIVLKFDRVEKNGPQCTQKWLGLEQSISAPNSAVVSKAPHESHNLQS